MVAVAIIAGVEQGLQVAVPALVIAISSCCCGGGRAGDNGETRVSDARGERQQRSNKSREPKKSEQEGSFNSRSGVGNKCELQSLFKVTSDS